MIIGKVKSGKTSFISLILGELKLLQGSIEVKGSISYADQDSWIFGASVKQNILFGQKFDKHRYNEVVKACALQKDFDQLPHGDQTAVGESGNSLSGGQKARINLARAIYRRADIYLLDDPLSAVDTHVGKHLFEECLQKYLAGKTRILVTHQLQYTKGADAILLLEQGKLYQYTSYQELLNAHPEYNTLIAEEKEKEYVEETIQLRGRRRSSALSIRSRASEAGVDFVGNSDDEDIGQDTFFEATSRGTVKGSLFLNYIRSGASVTGIFLVLILYLATQSCVSLYDYFITVLVIVEESREYHNKLLENGSLPIAKSSNKRFLEQQDIRPRDYYIYIYTGLVASIFLVAIIRSFAFYKMCLRASQRLHDLVFGALIRANMLFFDVNPSGRILNRSSKDLAAIDELLPRALLDSSQIILTMFGAVIVTCSVNVCKSHFVVTWLIFTDQLSSFVTFLSLL